nr:1,4-dihydroxy-6-naphthoate synthase [Saprospiraceae bacterium]
LDSSVEFDFVFADVEELNDMAYDGELDITKLSFNAFAGITDEYILLRSGSALGRSCGPLLITSKHYPVEALSSLSVAIPGMRTTANFLLDFYSSVGEKKTLRFDQIEDAVLSDEVDAGVIIHENRFTYADKGLIKMVDLGQHWEDKTGFPIPLGGIVARRSLPETVIQRVDQLIRDSIEFAYANQSLIYPTIEKHAQEMDRQVIQKHIDLYVNPYTIALGDEGEAAVDYFLGQRQQLQGFSLVEPWIMP